jgi:hypothetical protein
MRAVKNRTPQVVLLRVGMDSGVGGIQGPLLDDRGRFDFLPIPDDWNVDNPITYGNTRGRYGRYLAEYWSGRAREKYAIKAIHFDPEFKTFTYGDPTTPKQSLRWLEQGGMLVFYAGLQPWSEQRGFYGNPHLYIIGYFIVDKAGRIGDLFDQHGRDSIEREFARCIHVVKDAPIQKTLILVKGSDASRLFDYASLLSEYGKDRNGQRIKVLRHDLQKRFGHFSSCNYLQRSPPRWVSEEFARKAYDYVTRLR